MKNRNLSWFLPKKQVHAILKALPQNQSGEKKELDKEPSKDSVDKDKDREKDKPKSDSKKSDPTTTSTKSDTKK